MSKFSSTLNNCFSIASTGIDNGKSIGFEQRFGEHSATINGKMYHYLRNVTNDVNIKNFNGLSYFIFDHDGQLAYDSIKNFAGVDNDADYIKYIQSTIDEELKIRNRYVQQLKMIGNGIMNDNDTVETLSFTASLVKIPQYIEVGIVTTTRTTDRALKIVYNDGQSTSINWRSNLLEPLSYPLLFLHGEMGWGYDDRSTVSFKHYLCNKMLCPEYIWENGNLVHMTVRNKNDTKWIKTNRYQICARLSQVFWVDMWSRNIDGKLEYIMKNQDSIILDRSDRRGSIEEEQEEIGNKNVSTYLPASFHGGKRHLKQLARNAIAVVSEKSCSTAFITLTCNVAWKEIDDELLEGQTAFDRPDLVCEVIYNLFYIHVHLYIILINNLCFIF
jgi:hypothetical protein